MDREARIDAGRVIVSIDLRAGRVASATVRSERPRGLATLFVGRAPDAVPDLARRLFALCGLSQ
ncbi:nickel-dependent hydrogenase large subunit, partial [Rhodoplanes sp. TEM]|nr:nickel-dependent hydrogenase large subunit [Rhodoplanes sp. TEM]